MIIPITIDTTGLLDRYSQITRQDIIQMCDNVAKYLTAQFAAQLIKEANDTLHQTAARYKNAISVIDSGKQEGTVILNLTKDPMIRMLEEGASAFDMKIAFLKSAKVKLNKAGGRYLTIPFKWGTPGIVGESDVFSGIMPQGVYDVAKGLDTNTPSNRSRGLFVKELPTQYQSPATRAAIKDSAGKILFEKYEHLSSIYKGIFKKQDAVTGQNTYGSFRRVSDNSDPMAFIHPGIQRYALVQKALGSFNKDKNVEVSLNNEFKRLGLL